MQGTDALTPQDADITFVMNGYKDVDRAEWAIGELRKHYPDSRVLLIADGDLDQKWYTLSGLAEIYMTERCYAPVTSGGALWSARITRYLQAPTPYLVKMDTDTGWHRQLRLPVPPSTQACTFGERLPGSPGYGPYIQGGFIGITQAAIERVVASNILYDGRLTDPKNWCMPVYLDRIVKRDRISEDMVWGYICRQLAIDIVPYDDVKTTDAKPYWPNPNKKWAVTHPCKDKRL